MLSFRLINKKVCPRKTVSDLDEYKSTHAAGVIKENYPNETCLSKLADYFKINLNNFRFSRL